MQHVSLTQGYAVETPFGIDLQIAADERGIVTSRWMRRRGTVPTRRPRHPVLSEAVRQVRAYFARRLHRFDVPLALEGTPFQVAVWSTVARLERGELVSYVDIARAIGHPHAHRGVARAMSDTPLDLFIPAHRVIGSDGRIKGAAPGSMRRRLLKFEGIVIR